MIRFLPAIMLIIIGFLVLTLPAWLPTVADVRVTEETFSRAGTIGGGLIGVGVVFALIFGLRRKK